MNILEEILELSKPVEQVVTINANSFKNILHKKKKPIVIKGYAKNWGATKKWSLDYLISLANAKEISLLSGNYIQGKTKYQKSTLKRYLEKLKEAEGDPNFKDYLTTLDIFNYLPNLNGDTNFLAFEQHTSVNDVAAWIGPKGTVTGFHYDSGDNMYAQIKGEKLFVIAPPTYTKHLYPSTKYINGAVASKIDITNFNSKKFTSFKNVPFYKVVLQPGDVLFLPKKWWHYVQSLDSSISISNFGYTKFEILKMKVFNFLHRKGYYKPNNCYCCTD